MKQYLKHQNLPILAVLAGGVGALLRLWLLSTKNEKGFILRGHLSEILLLVLTAAFLVVLFAATRDLKQGSKYRFNFPPSDPAAWCHFAAAACILIVSAVELGGAGEPFAVVTAIAGFLAAGALAFCGYCRRRGNRPNMLFHSAICLYLLLRLICMYRSWSSDPQIENYCYQLLAIVCAMLAVYQRAAFDTGCGERAPHAFFSLAGVYFCCLSLVGPDSILFYVALGIWLMADLCRLNPMPRRRRRERAQ